MKQKAGARPKGEATEPTTWDETLKLSRAIQIDEEKTQDYLGEVARCAVEEMLNARLDAEAEDLCRAELCGRTEARKDMRAGFYQ